MRVTVLIVNWNSWEETVECLQSVFRSDFAGIRVVVCDNNSSDGSLAHIGAWARRAGLEYVEYTRGEVEAGGRPEANENLVLIQTGGNLGFAGGNNVGLQYALSDPDTAYIWLLNPDTVVAPASVSAMVALAEADVRIGVVGSKVLFYDEPDRIQAVGGGRVIPWQGMTRLLGRGQRDVGQWSDVVYLDYVTGCSMLVRAEMARAVGPLDERYFLYSEEVDWCIRARRNGWKLAYCPQSTVWHKEGRTVGKRSARSDYYSVRALLLLTAKFHPRLVPLAFAHSLYRCLLPKVVRPDLERFGAVMRAYRDFFRRSAEPSGAREGARVG